MSFGNYRQWWWLPHTSWPHYWHMHNAYNAGVILVGANGNNGNGEFYPAAHSEVIAVSAHGKDGLRAVWDAGANRMANEHGADIWTAGSQVADSNNVAYPNTGLGWADGTSFAAPIVAGAIALYVQQGKVHSKDSALTKLHNDAWYFRGIPTLDLWWGLTH